MRPRGVRAYHFSSSHSFSTNHHTHTHTHKSSPEMVEQVQSLVSSLVTMPEYDPTKAAGAATEELCRTGRCVCV